MTKKPTYEELEQRVKELEKGAVEHNRVEELLREREETIQAFLNATHDMMFLADSNGTIVALNGAAAKSLGKSQNELVGTCVFDALPPDVAESRRSQGEKVIYSGEPLCFEDEREGRWFDQSVYPVFDSQGKVVRIAIFAHETTELKRAEEALRKARNELERRVEDQTVELSVAIDSHSYAPL